MSKQVSQEQKIIDYMNRFGGDCHVARYSLKEGVNHAKQDFGFERHTV